MKKGSITKFRLNPKKPPKTDNVKLQFARSAVSGTVAEPDESKK